ncbi:MAG: thioredoxin family protein [Arenicella sp.]
MAKKKSSKKNKKPQPFNWKKNGKWIGIGLLLLTITGYLFVTNENQSRIEHDLSVIGNGKATVVQIHDPGCQLCRRLQSNVNQIKPDFDDKFQFRTANLKTSKGADFAKKYNVPHVTLLIFNRNGRHVNTLNGVLPKEQIANALSAVR